MKKTIRLLAIILLSIFQGQSIVAQNYAPGTDIIGFGYDVFGEYANQKSKKSYCLFEYKQYSNQMIGNKTYSVPQKVIIENISEHIIKTVSGESVREYASNLSAQVGLAYDGLFFSGSVNSSISQSTSGSTMSYYFTYMDANTKWRISLDTRNIDALKTMLEPQFKIDIDNMDPAELFETYGTHYIASAYLGGRADYNSISTISENTVTRDIELAVEAKYKSVSGNTALSSSNQNTLKNAKTETKLRVIGGNSEYANNIADPVTYEKWASGIADMPVLCDFDNKSLRPIWEFASTPKRKNQLQAEFEKLLKKYPLPAEIAQSIRFTNKFFFVKNKADGLYMDMKGYHLYAEAKSGRVQCFEKDVNDQGVQGADRFIKVIGHATESDYVFLQPQHSDFVMDIAGGAKTAGAQVQLWDKGVNNAGQMFKLVAVENEKNTYYVQVKSSGLYLTGNGKNAITQEALTNADKQKWVFEPANPYVEMAPPPAEKYAIQNVMGKRFIDVPGANKNAQMKNALLQLWDMDHDPDRYMIFHKSTISNYFVIQPMHSAYVWDIEGESKENTARLQLWERHDRDGQLFSFEFAGEPLTYFIVNKRSGKVIDASNTHVGTNGCPLIQYDKHGGDNQKWKLYMAPMWHMPPAGQNFYIKCSYSDKYFDLGGADTENNINGKELITWNLDGGGDRIFKIISANAHSWVNIQIQNGGRFVSIPSNRSENGVSLIIHDKTNGNDQKFAIMPTSPTTFVLRTNNWKAVDVEGGTVTENGKRILQWDTHFGASQQFQLIYADGPNKGQVYRFF